MVFLIPSPLHSHEQVCLSEPDDPPHLGVAARCCSSSRSLVAQFDTYDPRGARHSPEPRLCIISTSSFPFYIVGVRFQSHMQTKGDCVTPQQKRTSCWDSSRSTSRSHKVQRLFADKTITRDGSLLLCPLLPLVREWWAAVTVSCADYGTDGPPFVTALASSSAEQQGSLIT